MTRRTVRGARAADGYTGTPRWYAPVFAYPDGVIAVDARIVLSSALAVA